MKRRKLLITSTVLMILLISVTGKGQGRGTPYIGVNLSMFDSVIADNFTRYVNGVLNEKNSFEDDYKGLSGGIYYGYTLMDSDKTFINLQAHVNLHQKEFGLETPNSTLTRKLNYSFGIDLQPGLSVKSKLLCFFNFSVEAGKFKFSKAGTSTTYDGKPLVLGYGFGAGIGYQLTPSILMKLQYQHNQYNRTEISSTLVGAVTTIDTVELSPRYDIFMLAVQCNLR